MDKGTAPPPPPPPPPPKNEKEKKKDKDEDKDARSEIGGKELNSRRSKATSVFLLPTMSVTQRLGRHLHVEKYENEGLSEEAERKQKEAKNKKKAECQTFCCDRANKTCMGKGAADWIRFICFLVIFWFVFAGLLFAFFYLFTAMIGVGPGEGCPLMIDCETVKKNIGGWNGDAINFPFYFGAQLIFPGIHVLTLEIYRDSDNKTEKNKFVEYDKQENSHTLVTFHKIKKKGRPTDDWINWQSQAYGDYFDKHYNTTESNVKPCEKFRPFSDNENNKDKKDSKCRWPNSMNTSRESFYPYHCNKTEKKEKCFPIIYFTVNPVYGWVPQKIAVDDKRGNVHCEIDEEEKVNERQNLKEKDFSGSGECWSCEKDVEKVVRCKKCEGDSDPADDFHGIYLSRFPFLGQKDVKYPLMRYLITKMPKKDFVIRCRLEYPGYKKQMGDLKYPFDGAEAKIWSKIRINGATSYRGQLTLLFLSMMIALLYGQEVL